MRLHLTLKTTGIWQTNNHGSGKWLWKIATIAYISIQAILSILGIGGVGGCWWLVASYSPLVQSCYDVWNGTQEMKILFMRKNFSS